MQVRTATKADFGICFNVSVVASVLFFPIQALLAMYK